MAMGLIIVRGPGTGQTYTLGGEAVIVGREAQSAKFVIEDPAVSRRHARISRQGDTYLIEDLGSTNGTFINAERVMGRVPLTAGDLIELGTAVTLSYDTLDAANVTMLAVNQDKLEELVQDIVEQEYFQKLQEQMKRLRGKSDAPPDSK
jgi:pSer/pThr/pTyr-binding forkhead associated (FHA) protein